MLGLPRARLETAAAAVFYPWRASQRRAPVAKTASDASKASSDDEMTKTLSLGSLDVPLHGVSPAESIRLLSGAEPDFEGASRPAGHLHAFLSHSWRGCWWQKAVAVALYAYFPRALAAACVGWLAVAACVAGLALEQSCATDMAEPGQEFCRVPWISYGAECIFLAALALQVFFCRRSSTLFFLDKGCINQQDSEAIARGVSSLGGFLRHSQTLVTLWTDDYFQRLWCVFELACFHHFGGHRNSKDFVMIPVMLATLVMSGNVFLSGVWVCFDATAYFGVQAFLVERFGRRAARVLLALVVSASTYSVAHYIVYHLTLLRERLAAEVADFRTERASISLETDRERIEFCICKWYGSLDEFDRYVQESVLEHIRQQLGSSALVPYWAALAFSLPSALRTLDFSAALNLRGAVGCVGYVLIVNPIVFLSVQVSIQQQVLPWYVSSLISWLLLGLLWGVWATIAFEMRLVPFLAVFAALWLAVLWMYQPSLLELKFLGFRCGGRGEIIDEDSGEESFEASDDTDEERSPRRPPKRGAAGRRRRMIPR